MTEWKHAAIHSHCYFLSQNLELLVNLLAELQKPFSDTARTIWHRSTLADDVDVPIQDRIRLLWNVSEILEQQRAIGFQSNMNSAIDSCIPKKSCFTHALLPFVQWEPASNAPRGESDFLESPTSYSGNSGVLR